MGKLYTLTLHSSLVQSHAKICNTVLGIQSWQSKVNGAKRLKNTTLKRKEKLTSDNAGKEKKLTCDKAGNEKN